ncbi:undecaprenyldiphospho-muramoylpentapeptide beta-N-acetylglucosaminyltransferase [Bacillus fonticola]|uniref:undecaprenyldiphospho-muramoylpentapeptide beta-N-acetylglucosaminyltransferase n=1 Tax=Bacillus fonticola TaxID=2728853 RepID=UPI001473FF24|nr:undecaprenyldiphospho-muramoylpentapeptide beta-N-acetylglucosaminyltransferase [Bacillus fonticola]
MKRIVLTGGGTTGHVAVNVSLIPHLQEKGWSISYIGSYKGIEKELIEPLEGIDYHAISTGKLRRYLSVENVKDVFRVLKGIHQAKKILKKLKPDIVFSKGGFVSVPVVLAAKQMKIPVVTHESDRSPGLANRIGLPIAKKVCVTFEETINHLQGDKGVFVGPVIREAIFNGSRDAGRALVGAQTSKPILLVMGGSQGAGSMNTFVRKKLTALTEQFHVVHLCGKGKVDEMLTDVTNYTQFEYVNKELPDVLAATDLVMTRAGANSIFEGIALRKPMLLVPLPLSQSRGDQIENAEYFQQKGFVHVVGDEVLEKEPDRAFAALMKTYEARYELKETLRSETSENGVHKLVGVLEEVAR